MLGIHRSAMTLCHSSLSFATVHQPARRRLRHRTPRDSVLRSRVACRYPVHRITAYVRLFHGYGAEGSVLRLVGAGTPDVERTDARDEQIAHRRESETTDGNPRCRPIAQHSPLRDVWAAMRILAPGRSDIDPSGRATTTKKCSTTTTMRTHFHPLGVGDCRSLRWPLFAVEPSLRGVGSRFGKASSRRARSELGSIRGSRRRSPQSECRGMSLGIALRETARCSER